MSSTHRESTARYTSEIASGWTFSSSSRSSNSSWTEFILLHVSSIVSWEDINMVLLSLYCVSETSDPWKHCAFFWPSRSRLDCGSVKEVMFGEGTFGVVESVIRTCFAIGGCPGVIGAKPDSCEKVVVRDLFDVAICGLRGLVLRFNGVFWKPSRSIEWSTLNATVKTTSKLLCFGSTAGVAHLGDGVGGVFISCPGEWFSDVIIMLAGTDDVVQDRLLTVEVLIEESLLLERLIVVTGFNLLLSTLWITVTGHCISCNGFVAIHDCDGLSLGEVLSFFRFKGSWAIAWFKAFGVVESDYCDADAANVVVRSRVVDTLWVSCVELRASCDRIGIRVGAMFSVVGVWIALVLFELLLLPWK